MKVNPISVKTVRKISQTVENIWFVLKILQVLFTKKFINFHFNLWQPFTRFSYRLNFVPSHDKATIEQLTWQIRDINATIQPHSKGFYCAKTLVT